MKRLATVNAIGLLAIGCGMSDTPRTTSPSEVVTESEAIQMALGSKPSLHHGAKQGYNADDDPLAWREPGREQRFTAENFNAVLVTDSVQEGGIQPQLIPKAFKKTRIYAFGTAFSSHKRIWLVDANNDGIIRRPPPSGRRRRLLCVSRARSLRGLVQPELLD